MSELPLILAVDEDPDALQRITAELQRYARDYRVVCGPSTDAALAWSGLLGLAVLAGLCLANAVLLCRGVCRRARGARGSVAS